MNNQLLILLLHGDACLRVGEHDRGTGKWGCER